MLQWHSRRKKVSKVTSSNLKELTTTFFLFIYQRKVKKSRALQAVEPSGSECTQCCLVQDGDSLEQALRRHRLPLFI